MLTRLRDLVGALRRALAAGRLEAYRYLRDRREVRRAATRSDAGLRAEVAVYFPDPPGNLYQLRQWLPILAELDARHRVAIVCRSLASAELVEAETDLPVAVVKAFRELGPVYERVRAKVCLYVNNHRLNFQSLTFADQLHVHLNHGESDKISMASNQAKAYDRVFVAGPAATERYLANLLAFDGSTLVEVGRPQLDLLPPSRAADGRTVLYAPTWEGGRDEMDYSSVATMGEAIVDGLVSAGWRVVYRPHPKVGDTDPAAVAADRRIREQLGAAVDTAPAGRRRRRRGASLPAAGGQGHRVSPPEEPFGEAVAEADVVIADVSSVALDVLPTGKPVVVTRPAGAGGRVVDTGVTTAAVTYRLDPDDLPGIGGMLEEIVADDPLRDGRAAAVERFFGDTTPGASTRRFLAAIDAIVEERDRLVADKRARLAARATSREAT